MADTFIQCINTLDLEEIEQLNNDLKANGLGGGGGGAVKSVVETEDSVALLCIFQRYYYYNRRLPLTNVIIPDGETQPGLEKIFLNSLYEMFKDTKSHSFVSLQFLSVLNILSAV